jgi:hypothetical protein
VRLLIFIAAVAGCGLDPIKRDDGADTAVGATLIGDLQVTPGSLEFGSIAVGSLAEDSVVLRNVGTGILSIDSAEIVGDDGFSLSTTSPAPWSLASDAELILAVRFQPGEVSSYSGEVALSIDGQAGAGQIALAGAGILDTSGGDDTGGGTGTPGSLSLSHSAIDFGQVDPGSSDSIDVTVTNVGDEDVLVSDVTSTSSLVTTSGSLAPPIVLAGGSAKTLTVTFSPTAEVRTTATLTLLTDGAAQPTIEVVGEGYDFCDVCAPVIAVDTGGSSGHTMDGFVSLLGSTDTKTLLIQNEGDEDLVISRIEVKNDAIATCGSFSLSSTAGATLVPWDTMSVEVSYKATETCLEVANTTFDSNVLHIYNNDPSETDYIIELGAVGISL